jgi:hypothetical protein
MQFAGLGAPSPQTGSGMSAIMGRESSLKARFCPELAHPASVRMALFLL